MAKNSKRRAWTPAQVRTLKTLAKKKTHAATREWPLSFDAEGALIAALKVKMHPSRLGPRPKKFPHLTVMTRSDILPVKTTKTV